VKNRLNTATSRPGKSSESVRNAFKFRLMQMDRCFSSRENVDFITSKDRHFIAALKNNRRVALSKADRKKKCFILSA
jgi:hypothetical protein